MTRPGDVEPARPVGVGWFRGEPFPPPGQEENGVASNSHCRYRCHLRHSCDRDDVPALFHQFAVCFSSSDLVFPGSLAPQNPRRGDSGAMPIQASRSPWRVPVSATTVWNLATSCLLAMGRPIPAPSRRVWQCGWSGAMRQGLFPETAFNGAFISGRCASGSGVDLIGRWSVQADCHRRNQSVLVVF
jgi:hypothetical protein